MNTGERMGVGTVYDWNLTINTLTVLHGDLILRCLKKEGSEVCT